MWMEGAMKNIGVGGRGFGLVTTWVSIFCSCNRPHVEQRRKDALSRTNDDGGMVHEASLQEVISRYSFMDLWPCSSKDLDHLARQAWLAENMNKKVEKPSLPNGAGEEKSVSGAATTLDQSSTVVYPDITQMAIYEPGKKLGTSVLPSGTVGGLPIASATTSTYDGILKAAPPAIVAFIANLPAIEGPSPDVDFVLSICLQSNPVTGQALKHVASGAQAPAGTTSGVSEPSGSHKSRAVPSGSSVRLTRDRQGKRKDAERQDDDETTSVQSAPLPKDAFRIRQMQKARGGTASQTGSTSYGSAFSGGEQSGSTS